MGNHRYGKNKSTGKRVKIIKRLLSVALVLILILQLGNTNIKIHAVEMEDVVTGAENVTEQTTETDIEDDLDAAGQEKEDITENNLDIQEESVETDTYSVEQIPILEVNGTIELNEDTTVRRILWGNNSRLNLNGHTLIVTESQEMREGKIEFNGGKLVFENDFCETDKAELILRNVNDHLLVNGTMIIMGKIEFTKGIVEAKGDVSLGEKFLAGKETSFLISGEKKQTIQASDGSNLGNITIQNFSEEGIYVTAGFQYYELNDNNCRIEYGDIDGIRGYQLAEDEEYDEILRLINGTLDLNGHTLTVHGDFLQDGGIVCLNGGKLVIEGNYRLQKRIIEEDNQVSYQESNGTIQMNNNEDKIYVGNNFYAQTKTELNMLKGVIEIKGNMEISASSFECKQLLLSGEEHQNISLPKKNSISFLNLKNTGTDNITFINQLNGITSVSTNGTKVEGTISVSYPVEFAEKAYYGNVIFDGMHTIYNDLTIYGDVTFNYITYIYYNSQLRIYGNVLKSQQLYVGAGSICVSGNVENWNLHMNHSDAVVVVDGDYTVKQSGVYEKGIITIKGNINYGGNITVTENCELVLAGEKAQRINNAKGMYVSNLTLQNYSEEGVYIDSLVQIMTLNQNGCKYEIEGLVGVFGWTLTDNTEYYGDLILAGGELNLNGYTLTVHGDLIANQGNININGGNLTIQGNLRLQEISEKGESLEYNTTNSKLMMKADKASYLTVKGDTYISTKQDLSKELIYGYISFKGNVSVENLENTDYGISTGERITVYIEGDQPQTVDGGIRFIAGKLYLNNSTGITLKGNVGAYDQVYDCGNVIEGSCIFYDNTTAIGGVYHGDVRLKRSKYGYCKQIQIVGDVYLENQIIQPAADISVAGNCYETGGLTFAGKLTVEGDLGSADRYQYLLHNNKNSKIHVKGNVYLKNADLLHGNMQVDGDVYLNGCTDANEDYTLVLGGDAKQYLDVGRGVSLGIVELNNKSEEGIVAARMFEKKQLIRNGCKIRYEDVDGTFGWTMQEDERIDGDLILLGDTLDLNGHTLMIDGNLYQSSGVVKVNNGTLVVTGDYNVQTYVYNDGEVSFAAGDGTLVMTEVVN